MLASFGCRREHDLVRRLDARLGHRLRPVRERQQLSRRRRHVSSATRSSFTYITTVGDFGARGDECLLAQPALRRRSQRFKWNWVIQSDFLNVDSTGEENIGLNQYLFYTLSDAVSLGARLEWWQGDDITGYAPHGGVPSAEPGSQDYFEATIGANFKFARNFTLRPEIRYDWSDDLDYDETIAGVDLVFTF